jgi:hypothetical protein
MTIQFFIVGFCVYLVVLVTTVYFTRATARRFVGSLAGGAALVVLGVGVENLAHTLGWWSYPGVRTPYGTPLIYPGRLLALRLSPSSASG